MLSLRTARTPKTRKEAKMNGKKLDEFLLKEAKNVPFGIISGSLGIVAFFSTVGFVVAYAINVGIAAQTNRTATLFDNWYQTLLFIAVVISVIGGIVSLVAYVIKKLAMIAAHDPKYFDYVEDGEESGEATGVAGDKATEVKA